MAPSLIIKGLSYRYFETADPVFSDLDVEINGGSCCAILGPTGAGKTTLLQILSGIIGSQFTTGKAEGSVTIGSQTYQPIPPKVLFPHVGYVMQDPSLQLSGVKDTVHDEIAFTLDNMNMEAQEQETRLSEFFNVFDLSQLAQRAPGSLSGGEVQRVALASILVARPFLLLLDEPANALDSRTQQTLKSILKTLRGKATVLFSDTGLEFSLSIADHFLILDRGTIIFSGSRAEFLMSLPRFETILPTKPWQELKSRSDQVPSRLRHLLVPE